VELVSIVMAVFNGAATIEAAIESVRRQSYPQWELLVCDDGSSDATGQIAAASGDPRVRWLPGIPSGRPAVPRNRGIRAAKGEWLAFIDCDDEWFPDKLARQLELAQQNGYQAVCANAQRLFPDIGIVGNMMGIERKEITFSDLLPQCMIVQSSVMFRRDLAAQVCGFPEDLQVRVGEDYALWLRIAALTDFGVIFEPLLIYRDDAANSVRSTAVYDSWLEKRNIFRNFLQWSIGRNIRPEYLAAARSIYQRARREYSEY